MTKTLQLQLVIDNILIRYLKDFDSTDLTRTFQHLTEYCILGLESLLGSVDTSDVSGVQMVRPGDASTTIAFIYFYLFYKHFH